MLNKIGIVTKNIIFPQTHLEMYLSSCSQIEFEHKLTTRMQTSARIFAPYYYKDPFVRDCILELKERNNINTSRLMGLKISQWITHEIIEIMKNEHTPLIYVVPAPQHISKTREKGFAHAHTLAQQVVQRIPSHLNIHLLPCIEKTTSTKRLHDIIGKNNRFKIIQNTMRAHITRADAMRAYIFILDDVYTTGATFKEIRRSLSGCGVSTERIYFAAIAH